VDADSEVLVLNGTREGLFLAAIAAKRWVARRAGNSGNYARRADPQSRSMPLTAPAPRRDCEPSICGDAGKRLLADLDALGRRAAGAHRRLLHRPSNPQGAVASRAYLEKLAGLARRFGSWYSPTMLLARSISEHQPSGMWKLRSRLRQCRRVSFAVQALETCPACASARRRRSAISFRLSRIAANVAAPQVPAPAQYVASPPMATRPTSRKPQALCGQVRSRRPDHRTASITNVRRADFSLARRRKIRRSEIVTKRLWQEAGVRVRSRPLSGARAGRRQQSRRGLHPLAMVQDKATTAEALHRLVAVLG